MLEAKTFSTKHYDGSLQAVAEAEWIVQHVKWRHDAVCHDEV